MNVSTEAISPWPLSAATTQVLLMLGPAGSTRGKPPPGGPIVKLAVKELFLRGAWRITSVDRKRLRKPTVMIEPNWHPPVLPSPLDHVDGPMRRQGAGDLKTVIKGAVRGQSRFSQAIVELCVIDLLGRGLADQFTTKRLGMFSSRSVVRTQAGDAWAQTAGQHVAAVEGLPNLVDRDPLHGEQIVLAGAALLLLVPGALGAVARLRRRRPGRRGFGDADGDGGDDAELGAEGALAIEAGGFDVLDGFDSAFGEVIDAAGDALDSAGGAIDSALDAAAGAVDSAIDSGVDAGGGGDSGGGDGGGGGGD